MSTITERRNHARASVDRAIREHLAAVECRDADTRAALETTLRVVRSRTGLLRPPLPSGRHQAWKQGQIIGALLALGANHRHWRRPVEGWQPAGEKPLGLLSSLAQHLLADYPVPDFMASAWFRGRGPEALQQQLWYLHLGLGRNIRTADIPLPYTKMMAHHFMQAPHHFAIETALRWGQVRGLGGSQELAGAISSTRLGRSFGEEDFWKTVIQFFINHPDLSLNHIGPIVDYLNDQKFAPQLAFDEHEEAVPLGPPQPDLEMRGRSPRMLLRQIKDWRDRLKQAPRHWSRRWKRSGIGPFQLDVADPASGSSRRWTIRELLSGGELHHEGRAMRHCVATYAWRCLSGKSSIWSMRLEDGYQRYRVMTIEVDPASKTICQARRRDNAPPNPKARRIMECWADQEGLTIAEYV